MTDLRQRAPRKHDEAHLKFVRAQPCSIKFCPRPSEAAHIRMACLAIGKASSGLQEKPDDKWTCPLCEYHHRTGTLAQHKMAEGDFWSLMGLNPFEIAARLWIESGGAAREASAEPKLAKPRKIGARSSPERRKKIQSGRKIQSNPVIQSRPFEKRPAR